MSDKPIDKEATPYALPFPGAPMSRVDQPRCWCGEALHYHMIHGFHCDAGHTDNGDNHK